jgi:hypothetical protein
LQVIVKKNRSAATAPFIVGGCTPCLRCCCARAASGHAGREFIAVAPGEVQKLFHEEPEAGILHVRTVQSVLAMAATQTGFLDDPAIAETLSGSDFAAIAREPDGLFSSTLDRALGASGNTSDYPATHLSTELRLR